MSDAFAPGRLNLIGEHIDYSGGPVLPFPLPLGTRATGVRAAVVDATSAGFPGRVRLAAGERGRGWGRALAAAWAEVRAARPGTAGWRGRIESDLPVGAGLSSSASLLVAAIRLWDRLYALRLRPADIAAMAWRAETGGLGKPVGPMDPFAVSLGRPGHALLFDCARLRGRLVRLPPASWVAFQSGVTRALARTDYALRRSECERAARLLGLARLADARPSDLARLRGAALRRARHVVTECARVRAAARALSRRDAPALGRLLTASHSSLRDDFEVSLPAVDRRVEEALAAGALGARMVGGGFGGAILALWKMNDARATSFAVRAPGVFWTCP
jgi:galactokinase